MLTSLFADYVGDSSIDNMKPTGNSYKLIAVDIDGTLRDESGDVRIYTKDVFIRCKKLGAVIVAATGRSRVSAMSYLHSLPMIEWLVSFQGSLITSVANDEVLWNKFLSQDEILLALDFLDSRNVQKVVYLGDRIYVEELTPWSDSYGERTGVEVLKVDNLREIKDNVYRILAVGSDEDIEKLDIDMNKHFFGSLYVTRSLPHFCEVLSGDAGKEKALQWICNSFGIGRHEVISFGNGFNDVEMLRWSGLGVAMEDGEIPALEVADDLALNAGSDGVGRYLEGLLSRDLIG